MSRRRSCMHYWWLTLNLWIQIYDRVFDLHFLSAQLAGVYLGANLLITVTLKGLRCRLEWTDRRRTPPKNICQPNDHYSITLAWIVPGIYLWKSNSSLRFVEVDYENAKDLPVEQIQWHHAQFTRVTGRKIQGFFVSPFDNMLCVVLRVTYYISSVVSLFSSHSSH